MRSFTAKLLRSLQTSLLMEQLNYNLMYRWFVGLSPDDPVWDLLANWQVTLVTAALLIALPIAAVNLWRRRKRIDAEALGEEAEKFATPAALYIIFFGAALLFYAGLAFALFKLAMFVLLQ